MASTRTPRIARTHYAGRASAGPGQVAWPDAARGHGEDEVSRAAWRNLPQSPWVILGISPSASEDDIRAAHRTLVIEIHPDRNPGDEAAAERMKLVTWAFSILVDEDDRSAARQHFHPEQTTTREAPTRGQDVVHETHFVFAKVQWGRMHVVQLPGRAAAVIEFPEDPTPEFTHVREGEGGWSAGTAGSRGDLIVTVHVDDPTEADRVTVLLEATSLLARVETWTAQARDEGQGREAMRIQYELERVISGCSVDAWQDDSQARWEAVRWLHWAKAEVQVHRIA